MDEQSNSADKGEQGKTNRNDVANQLIGDQHHVFPGDERIEFAFAVLSHSEVVGQFPDPQRPRRRGQEIEQDLVSLAAKAPESPFEDLPP